MNNFIENCNVLFYNESVKHENNSNIIRKIIHSYVVANYCFEISSKLNLNERERQLAYFIGLFHDIGRFTQWEQYRTYNDHLSEDHGVLSYKVCKTLNLYMLSEKEQELCLEVIKQHNKPNNSNNETILLYDKIIKNADAFSNIITTANGAQKMTVDVDGVTPQILQDFLNMQQLGKYSPKTKLDRALMLTACTYYVKYDFLRRDVIEKNYIDIIYQTFSKYLNESDKMLYKQTIDKFKIKYLETLNNI